MTNNYKIKIDYLEKNLDRIHGWILSADQKISIFLAFQALILGFFGSTLLKVLFLCYFYFQILFYIIFVSVLLIVYSVFNNAFALIPKLKKSTDDKSTIYFSDISKLSIKEYKKLLAITDNLNYKEDIINQIYNSSKIATLKHKQLQKSITIFLIGIGIAILSYVYIIFDYYVR